MKTRIKKITVIAAALLFLGSGVSFAHDWNRGYYRPHGHAYGHYKKWYGHHGGWHKKHFKHRRHHRGRYVYKEVHHHHYDSHHRRRAPREDVIYKTALKDPKVIFKIIVKDHGFF